MEKSIRSYYGMSEGSLVGVEDKYDLFAKIVDAETEEYESFEVKGLGWVVYGIEDNAGSVLIYISVRDYGIAPLSVENFNVEDLIAVKMCFYGSYGNEAGIGCLYTRLENGTFIDKKEFASYEEGRIALALYLENTLRYTGSIE